MNVVREPMVRWARRAYRALLVVLLIVAMLVAAPSAMAQRKKKKEEVDTGPKKSYVLPYFIVMMLAGVGIMTVCRPGSRKDRPEEKRKPTE
jgi:hypothetical protein